MNSRARAARRTVADTSQGRTGFGRTCGGATLGISPPICRGAFWQPKRLVRWPPGAESRFGRRRQSRSSSQESDVSSEGVAQLPLGMRVEGVIVARHFLARSDITGGDIISLDGSW